MITEVRLDYFKRFESQEFTLADTIVLAGPNNSGKSTLLQAITVWGLAVQRWQTERLSATSKATKRTGIAISRKDFSAVPLREMNLLWFNRDTAYSKLEKPNEKAGAGKLISISLTGVDSHDAQWTLTVKLRYHSKELIYAKVVDATGTPVTRIPPGVEEFRVVHVPPFSGIGTDETRYDPGYQNLLIGQGKPGDILRNLLLEVEQKGKDNWEALQADMREIFGYELTDPQYSPGASPYILVEYHDIKSPKQGVLDIASAGSGFHQVLTLLSFFYARPASILLLDEPDAHQHVKLQRQVYDKLRSVARRRRCQLLISTHSEVILEDTEASNIISFYGHPHQLLVDTEKDRVREALKLLSSMEIISALSGTNVLYVEDESDFKILREFARILEHRSVRFFDEPFFHAIRGRHAKNARDHFFALQAIRPQIKGVLLLDADDRDLPDHEVSADGLEILRWERYEIESYLIHPDALLRFLEGPSPDLFRAPKRAAGKAFLESELPPAVLRDPLGHHEYLLSVPASKSLLPSFFDKADTALGKKDYYQIAAQMTADELPSEVRFKLDRIADALDISA